MYSLNELCTCYGEKFSLERITLDIPPGFVLLIGPNGSGKTTLLRVLAGLMSYSGSVSLNGHEVSRISRKNFARRVSFMMSDKNFRPSYPFTAREIIAMGRLPYRGIFSRFTPDDEAIIAHSADALNITHLLSRDIMTLSDGERQLVFIASLIAQDTHTMLLDEPTSSLDPDKSARVFEMLRGLAGEGRNVIAAVHDVNISGDYYLALREGVLISHGEKLNEHVLRELYDTNFTAYHNTERNDVMWRALSR